MSDAVKALLLPFAQGLLAIPEPGRALFLRAEADAGFDAVWRRALVCEQSFKPGYDTLLQRGYRVEREASGDGFDVALCLLTKHKVETLANLARAWGMLRPGGLLVCAGGNDVGAGSIERALKAAAGEVASLSKHHCKVFWATRNGAVLTDWAEAGKPQVAPQTGFWSRPGIYNWNKIDDGSALLAAHLPADLAGKVADLGAGWGYLSLELSRRCPAIATLDLFEAEWHALAAARANLPHLPATAFHWHDVTTGLPQGGYDAIVMNPPFHQGKAADVDLGRAFIAAAAPALAAKGRLFLVANRQLPYEAVVAAKFRRWQTLVETGAYKVIQAQV